MFLACSPTITIETITTYSKESDSNDQTTVTSTKKRKYAQEGYAIFQNVLDAELMSEAKEHIHWLMKKYPDKRCKR